MEAKAFVKIKSSVVLFGGYECSTLKYHMLFPDCFTLSIKNSDAKLNLLLSFKHINRVELFDNREDKGAGMVVYVNEFMARKLQETLDKDGNGFLNFKSAYAENWFFVLDVINCDKDVMRNISEMLRFGEDFHRRYVIEQCNKSGKDVSDSLPSAYISVIHSNQWRALLGTMGKDIFLEKIETESSKYTIATICAAVKNDQVFSIKRDGSMVLSKVLSGKYQNTEISEPQEAAISPNSAKGGNFLPLASQTLDYVDKSTPRITLSTVQNSKLMTHSPIKNNGSVVRSALRNASTSASRSASTSVNPAVRNPLSAKRSSLRGSQTLKREVPVIEFDEGDDQQSDKQENIEGGSRKRVNDTVFVYPEGRSGGTNTCSVHFSDLKYLDKNFMLNDTVIDFYLKYIFHDLVDEERRHKIFMFNSFFYSRLSQPPAFGRPNVTPATRSKRVQTNFTMIRSWTKKVNLFEKDYIIVPINEDIHWYLAIVVNPKAGIVYSANETLISKRCARPYVVIFDSLIDPCEPKHILVRQHLAEYFSLEYHDKKAENALPGIGFDKSSLEVINPKGMPQQKNYIDCGVFLLHFAEIFMTNPPKKLTKRASFMDWYPDFQIKNKRSEIRAVIQRLAPEIKYSDFLPEVVKSKPKKGKKSIAVEIQPTLTRRHSTSVLAAMKKDKHFTSSLTHSRSYDSIVEAMKESPPLIISVMDLRRQQKMEI